MERSLCPACKDGPSGLEGHHAISIDRYPVPGEREGPLFRCGACGAIWRRNYAGDGLFMWSPAAAAGSSRETK